MSAINFAKLVAEQPLPAFASPGGAAELTIYGQTCTVYSALIVQPAQSFHIFNDFHVEIQTKIWGFADIGRTITAVERLQGKANDNNVALATMSDDGSDENDDENDDDGAEDSDEEDIDVNKAFKFTGAGYPIIFQVSKGVFSLAVAMGYKPMFQVHGSGKVVYFNPQVDTLRLLTSFVRHNLKNQIALSKALVDSSELKMIRRLRLNLPSYLIDDKSVLKDIRSMVSLQELTLFGICAIRPSSPQFTMKLRFEFDGEKAVPMADIPGNRLTGDRLNRAVKHWVPAEDEQERWTYIFNEINNNMKECALDPKSMSFPYVVKTELTYVDTL